MATRNNDQLIHFILREGSKTMATRNNDLLILLEMLCGSDTKALDDVVKEADKKLDLQLVSLSHNLTELLHSQENIKILTPAQRLVGFAFLLHMYASQQPSSNPYISFLIEAACNESAESYERAFILQLLDSSGDGFPSLEQLQQRYVSKDRSKKQTSTSTNIGVTNILSDPDVPRGCDINSEEFDKKPGLTPKIGSGDRDETLSGVFQKKSGIGPKWIRPRPPRLHIMEEELEWLNPGPDLFVWEDLSSFREHMPDVKEHIPEVKKHIPEVKEHIPEVKQHLPEVKEHIPEVKKHIPEVKEHIPEVRELISNALKTPLALAYQEHILEGLKKNPKFVSDSGLTPLKLPGLVKNNPEIALEVLIQLSNSPEKLMYFTILVGMDMSISSMEVFYRLATTVELPVEVIQLYITNCTSCCDKCEDTYMRSRLVRLVCIFLQSLIKNSTMDVQNLHDEVKDFCSKFKDIKEVAGLARLFKVLLP